MHEPAATLPTPDLRVFNDPEAVARAAAARFVELARAAVRARGMFAVALAGGSTPKRIYELLATEAFSADMPWPHVHICFGDERCVPLDHADSNYRMANEALLSRVPLPAANVHPMNGVGDAAANARLYEDELRTFFDGEGSPPSEWPRLDLVMLGMGDDGHTASLFPGTEALRATSAWVVANWVDKFDTYRLTLSAPAINHAANIMFVVTGANKADRLVEVLRGAPDAQRLPAQLIRPVDGALEWLLDRAAAAKL